MKVINLIKNILTINIFAAVIFLAGSAETLRVDIMLYSLLSLGLSIFLIFKIEEKQLEKGEISQNDLVIYHYDENGEIINNRKDCKR